MNAADQAVPGVAASATPGAEELLDEGRRARLRLLSIWLLTAALGVMATFLTLRSVLADPQAALPDARWLALVPFFALAEVVVIHLPTQRNAHGHTLREVPAVLGLTFLAPQQYVTAYVVGAVLALAVAARMRGVKLAFNAAMFSFEAAVGQLTYHAVLDGGDAISPHGWAAVLAAVLVTDLVSAAAVTAAISLTEGAFEDEVLREALRSGMVAAFINTCLALIIAILVVVQPTGLPLLGAVLALLVVAYRRFVALARGHARTQLLYRFVDKTSAAGRSEEVIRVVLGEAAELLHAERAYVVELEDAAVVPSVVRCHALRDGQVQTTQLAVHVPAPWWWAATEGQVVRYEGGPADRLAAADSPSGSDLVPASPRDGVAAPVRQAGKVRTVLVVCDRSFEQETFGADDVQVIEALAAHAGVAVERARSVSRLERLVEERAYEARHDPLSGLLNRRAFNDAAAVALRGESGADEQHPCHGIVLLLDLDDFKDVNDTLGHSAGDRLITVTAGRLTAHAKGVVARLGGDEFAVLLPGLSLEQGLAHARALHEMLTQPVPLGEVMLTVSASIGVAPFHSLTESAEDLLAQADVAMYTAKADRTGVAPYRPEAGDSTVRRLALAADLPAAIEQGQVELWYQPQADPATGAITGFEALVRWNHPRFGRVPPQEVVAVAHRTGRMRQLTDALIERALTSRRSWFDAGYDFDVSVNVTPRDVADSSLVTRVQRALTATGTPPSALVLEITESDAMKDPERSLGVLTAISQLGVRLSVDDFGTGYSSLAYLDSLPVDEVKIDQSFVFRLEQESSDSTIVAATIGLAHDLGLRVVAEGVENELTRRLVRELGADLYQGYGLARPMPGDDVLPWVSRHAELVSEQQPIDATFALCTEVLATTA